MWMANKQMKKCSTLVITEMQIKTIARGLYIPIKWQKHTMYWYGCGGTGTLIC